MKPSAALACRIALCLATTTSSLHAQAAPTSTISERDTHAPSIPSTNLTLTIDGKPTTLSLADLQSLPQTTVTVHNEHTKADEAYTGVLLGILLAQHGLPVDKITHRKMLRSYLTAEGTDKYWVLYSLTEIEPSEHNGSVLIATAINGKPLAEDGQLKLVDSEDKKPERWVKNLNAITVKSAE